MALTFKGGSDTGSGFVLLPEMTDTTVTFISAAPLPDAQDRLRFIFSIKDYDDDDVPEGTPELRATQHYEHATVPRGPVTPRHKLHKILSWLIGHTMDEDEEVDIESFFGRDYKADFKHVTAQEPDGSGGFRPRRDENGKGMKKAEISAMRVIKTKKRKPAPVVEDDEDENFDWKDDE